jgi:hypothetical protein
MDRKGDDVEVKVILLLDMILENSNGDGKARMHSDKVSIEKSGGGCR